MTTATGPRVPTHADVCAELMKIYEKAQTFKRLVTTDAKVAQTPMDVGLFGEQGRQADLVDMAREAPPKTAQSIIPREVRVRRHGLPKGLGAPISSYVIPTRLREHPDFAAAKAGDGRAAVQLVLDIVRRASLQEARRRFGSDVIYAAASNAAEMSPTTTRLLAPA